jgi:hypothetical protein
MHSHDRQAGRLCWVELNDLVEILKRAARLTHVAPDKMTFEIGAKIARIFFQPIVHNLEETLRIVTAKFLKLKYFLG